MDLHAVSMGFPQFLQALREAEQARQLFGHPRGISPAAGGLRSLHRLRGFCQGGECSEVSRMFTERERDIYIHMYMCTQCIDIYSIYDTYDIYNIFLSIYRIESIRI